MVFRVLEVFQKFRVLQPYGGGLLALTLQMLVLKPKPTPLNPKPRAPSLNLLMTWLVRSISVGLIDPVPI